MIGQDRAKRVLSVAVHNHYKRLKHSGKAGDVELSKSNILLVGPTGSRQDAARADAGEHLRRAVHDGRRDHADRSGLRRRGRREHHPQAAAGERLQRREGAARHRLHRRDRQDQPQGGKPLDHPRRVGRGRAAGAAQADGGHHRQRSAAGRAQASAAGIPAGRHHQHPVHLRRRVRGPRQDHRRPPAEALDRLRRACRRSRQAPRRRAAPEGRAGRPAQVRADPRIRRPPAGDRHARTISTSRRWSRSSASRRTRWSSSTPSCSSSRTSSSPSPTMRCRRSPSGRSSARPARAGCARSSRACCSIRCSTCPTWTG